MTVQELMEKLAKLDSAAEAIVWDSRERNYVPVQYVEHHEKEKAVVLR